MAHQTKEQRAKMRAWLATKPSMGWVENFRDTLDACDALEARVAEMEGGHVKLAELATACVQNGPCHCCGSLEARQCRTVALVTAVLDAAGDLPMNFWEFYNLLVGKVLEADPDFPSFDHENFIERLMEKAVALWQELMLFVHPSPARYEEHWEQLSPRDRYWHWFCCTIGHASYGSGQAVYAKEIFVRAKYNSQLEGVGAPVPVKAEILGGPAVTILFTDDEVARMQRVHEATKGAW